MSERARQGALHHHSQQNILTLHKNAVMNFFESCAGLLLLWKQGVPELIHPSPVSGRVPADHSAVDSSQLWLCAHRVSVLVHYSPIPSVCFCVFESIFGQFAPQSDLLQSIARSGAWDWAVTSLGRLSLNAGETLEHTTTRNHGCDEPGLSCGYHFSAALSDIPMLGRNCILISGFIGMGVLLMVSSGAYGPLAAQ